jgi:hypothetical protein
MRRKRVTREIRRWGTLRWRLSMFVFAIMLLSGILTALVFMILNLTIGFSPILTAIAFNPTTLIIVLLCVCTLIGTALAMYFSTYYLRPLKRLISATHEVKNGNFKVQVRIDEHQAKPDVSVKPPREMDILIEVNIGDEESKGGFDQNNVEEAIRRIAQLPHIHIKGLMSIPPIEDDDEKVRAYFAATKRIFVDIKHKNIDNVTMEILSMGMSGDFAQAILEDSTQVRIGTALFGPRNYSVSQQ